MTSFNKAMVLGVSLLIASIILYLYLSFLAIPSRDVYDELVTWFHVHVINTIRAGSFEINDYSLRFINGRNLLRSPVLIDFVIAYLNINPGAWTLFTGILMLLVVFFITKLVTGNYVVSGFAALIVSTTPCFNYWFKYSNFGAYTLKPVFFIALIALYFGFIRKNAKLLIVGSAAGSILWFTWSDGWLVLLVYSVFVSALLFKNIYAREYLYPAFILLGTTLPLNIVLNYEYVTILHAFSYLALLFATLLTSLIKWLREILNDYSLVPVNIISAISVYVISLYLSIIINNYIQYPGLAEDYSAVYNPLFDYGLTGILSLLALVMIIRSRVLQDIKVRSLDFMLLSSFIIGVVLSNYSHPLTVITISSITPYIALSIITIASTLRSSGTGRLRTIYFVISIWLITSCLVASAIPSYAVARYSPLINIVDIPRELVRKITINESGFINTMSFIRDLDSNKLIICHWRYSYWVVGILGPNTYTLADSKGDYEGWRIYSWIMLSSEHAAYELIKKIIGNRTDIEVYIVVSEIISVDLTSVGEKKLAQLGEAIIYPSPIPGRPVEVTYQVYGDVAKILQYIRIAGFNYTDYLTARGLRYHHEYPLAWTYRALDTVLVKLIVNGLDALGYDVFNSIYSRIYGERFLNRDVEKPRYFRLVNATVTPLYRVSRDIYDFQISLYVAIYKVEL